MVYFLVSLAAPFSNCFLHCLVVFGSIVWQVSSASGFDKRPRRTFARSPQAVPWENELPWVVVMVVQIAASVPGRDDRGLGFACAKAVGKSTCRGGGTNITARIPTAYGRACRWQAIALAPAKRRMPDETIGQIQHAEAQRARRQRAASSPQPPNPPVVAPARGHAAKIFCPLFMRSARML